MLQPFFWKKPCTHVVEMAEEGCCPCKKQSRCLRFSCGRVCSDCIPSSMGTCCNRVKKPSGCRPPDTQCAKSPPGPSHRMDSFEVSSQSVLSCEDDDDFIPSLSSSFSAIGGSPDGSCETLLVDNPCGGSLEETVSPPLDALTQVPHGKHGKSFVRELSRLFQDSPMECIALKAAFLLPLLVLQKLFQRSKNRGHVQALERRLDLWHDGLYWTRVRRSRRDFVLHLHVSPILRGMEILLILSLN